MSAQTQWPPGSMANFIRIAVFAIMGLLAGAVAASASPGSIEHTGWGMYPSPSATPALESLGSTVTVLTIPQRVEETSLTGELVKMNAMLGVTGKVVWRAADQPPSTRQQVDLGEMRSDHSVMFRLIINGTKGGEGSCTGLKS